MEGNDGHGYLQGDGTYDELINTWPASTEHYAYQEQQQHPTQATFVPQYSNQPSFDHFDVHHQPYPSVPYSNSPYSSQSQYQHARPSDVFGPTAYDLDPALQTSGAYPASSSFSFGLHGADNNNANNNTISPQSLQYQIASVQTPVDHGPSNTAFQKSTNDYNQRPQDPMFFIHPQNGNLQNTESSIQYPALPSGSDPQAKQESKNFGRPDDFSSVPAPARLAQPQAQNMGAKNGLRTTHPELHASENPSSRPRFEFAPFLSWEDVPIQVAPGPKNTLPKYHPRRSRSGKDLVPGLDIFRTTNRARISTKKIKIKTPKEQKPTMSKYKGTSQGKIVHEKLATLRGDDLGTVKPPSTPTETSSSEEETSSEEESEYEEDEDMPVQHISSVRALTRPTDVAEAARWDAIGIVWKDPNSSPNADVIKGAIEEYGNFVSALRVQLKTNSSQIEEAASRPEDVGRLKTARRVLLESLYQTINAANTLGYPAIVENLGSHQKLVNGLTTTLIECIKTEDFLGKLPKAVFSLLAKFQNMSDALLKKLKFDSITKRWNKKGDEDIKKLIAAILANTIEAKEKASQAEKEPRQVKEAKSLRDKVEQSKQRNADSLKAASSPSNPAKRPYDGDGASSKPSKKFASDVSGTLSSTSKPLPPKRTTNLLANNLLGISSKPAVKAAPKKSEPSFPTESKLGALLAQIAEPVKSPKAPEAKPLPPETPEEKKRRERKESRRHLRVKFKEGPELEEIKLFKHEQAEDEGRQDDMLRDAHDERSEGMMHKQRVSEAMDSAMEDDDDYDPENITFEERPYPNLVGIDFSGLEKTTKFGPTYATRGGEKTVTTHEQQAQERREALELMAVYTDPKDIPSTPKEPPHGEDESGQQERELKGPNEPWVVQRLQEAQHYGPTLATQLLQQRKQMNIHDSQIHHSSSMALQNSSAPASQPPNESVPTRQSNTPQRPPPTLDAAALENLQRIVNSLKGKPFPPIEPPDWMTNPQQRADWWDGYNRDKAAKEKRETEAQIAQMRAAQYQTSPMLAPQVHQPMPMPMPPMIVNPFPPPQSNMIPQAPDMTQQVQAYLAGLQPTGDIANVPTQQQYDYNGWSGGNGQERDYGDYDEQKRREDERDKENIRSKKKQGHNKNNNSKDRGFDMKQYDGASGYGNDGLFDENGEYKGKKKPCRFWVEGKCAKGAKCTYLHEDRN